MSDVLYEENDVEEHKFEESDYYCVHIIVCLYSALSTSGEDSKRSSDNLSLFALLLLAMLVR